MKRIGVIGGSGLDDPDILEGVHDVVVDTPWGLTASPMKSGHIGDKEVFLVARHGRQHTDPPTTVNNRANIWSLRQQHCDAILATTAVGSLRQEIDRGHLVVLDQFIDFTRHRNVTFFDSFDPADAKHTPMADPFNETLRQTFIASLQDKGLAYHPKGTVVTIEGPRFSTRAESHMFRAWGADVINMSTAPECILANEAGIPYAAVAMSTDYDCWKEDEAPVTWEEILRIFSENAAKVTDLLVDVIKRL